MPIVSLAEWEQYLQKHPEAHFLQSGEWGELKSAFGWKPVRVVNKEAGAQLLFRRLPLGFTIGYIPKPAINNQLASDLFWAEIDSVCRRNRAVFLKLEPDLWADQTPNTGHPKPDTWNLTPGTWNLKPGTWNLKPDTRNLTPDTFKPSPHNIQPPRTIIIDLRGTDDEILARMKQKTRYNIRLAEKKGVTVHSWDDLEAFHRMMLVTGGRDGFGVHALEYYRRAYELLHPKQMGEILVAEYGGKPLAALFVARRGTRAYYLYGASTDEERNRMPTYLLQWAAMQWAKAAGCEEYDLWGVPDEEEAVLEANFEERRDGLWGVYRFKRGFGGELKRAAQALDRVYQPLLYWAYLRFVGNRE